MDVASLPKDWVATPLLHLLFQNLIVEECTDIRDATIAAWKTAIDLLRSRPGWMETVITSPQLLEWFDRDDSHGFPDRYFGAFTNPCLLKTAHK
jgi:TATA-binding protein-associated factor